MPSLTLMTVSASTASVFAILVQFVDSFYDEQFDVCSICSATINSTHSESKFSAIRNRHTDRLCCCCTLDFIAPVCFSLCQRIPIPIQIRFRGVLNIVVFCSLFFYFHVCFCLRKLRSKRTMNVKWELIWMRQVYRKTANIPIQISEWQTAAKNSTWIRKKVSILRKKVCVSQVLSTFSWKQCQFLISFEKNESNWQYFEVKVSCYVNHTSSVGKSRNKQYYVETNCMLLLLVPK